MASDRIDTAACRKRWRPFKEHTTASASVYELLDALDAAYAALDKAETALRRHHDWSKGGVQGYRPGTELYDLTVRALGVDTDKVQPPVDDPHRSSAALGVEMLTRSLHDAYEELAPAFGYEPRRNTRVFSVASQNGRLMLAAVERASAPLFAELASLREQLAAVAATADPLLAGSTREAIRAEFCTEVAAELARLREREAQRQHYVDPVTLLDSLWKLFAGNQSDALIEEMFPGCHESYLMEWRLAFNRGFYSFWAKMDDENRVRFVAILLRIVRSDCQLNTKMMIDEWKERGEEISRLREREALWRELALLSARLAERGLVVSRSLRVVELRRLLGVE